MIQLFLASGAFKDNAAPALAKALLGDSKRTAPDTPMVAVTPGDRWVAASPLLLRRLNEAGPTNELCLVDPLTSRADQLKRFDSLDTSTFPDAIVAGERKRIHGGVPSRGAGPLLPGWAHAPFDWVTQIETTTLTPGQQPQPLAGYFWAHIDTAGRVVLEPGERVIAETACNGPSTDKRDLLDGSWEPGPWILRSAPKNQRATITDRRIVLVGDPSAAAEDETSRPADTAWTWQLRWEWAGAIETITTHQEGQKKGFLRPARPPMTYSVLAARFTLPERGEMRMMVRIAGDDLDPIVKSILDAVYANGASRPEPTHDPDRNSMNGIQAVVKRNSLWAMPYVGSWALPLERCGLS